ncbi:unnamed protein product [Schistosoma curassoni]|uniref:Uncharacterized protein n=2 Tax=Schistosoma TaxID=6181 RepID=A0A183JDT3_9TREM|nr:unnamed protein product [Schistosoma margrebowiei]VDO64149.1 unnamed protein product [Schistosoma curassoni]
MTKNERPHSVYCFSAWARAICPALGHLQRTTSRR